jgi:hypothetical protein
MRLGSRVRRLERLLGGGLVPSDAEMDRILAVATGDEVDVLKRSIEDRGNKALMDQAERVWQALVVRAREGSGT